MTLYIVHICIHNYLPVPVVVVHRMRRRGRNRRVDVGRMRRPVRVEVIVISVCGGVHVGVVLMVVVGRSVVRHGEVSCLTSLNNLDPAWVRLRRLK